MDCDTAQIFDIVAVGAMAIKLELRMPWVRTLMRKASQSRR